MRLLVSCIPYDKGKSGISVYVREVVRELAAQGHELTLLCEPEACTEDSLKFKVESEKYCHICSSPDGYSEVRRGKRRGIIYAISRKSNRLFIFLIFQKELYLSDLVCLIFS